MNEAADRVHEFLLLVLEDSVVGRDVEDLLFELRDHGRLFEQQSGQRLLLFSQRLHLQLPLPLQLSHAFLQDARTDEASVPLCSQALILCTCVKLSPVLVVQFVDLIRLNYDLLF